MTDWREPMDRLRGAIADLQDQNCVVPNGDAPEAVQAASQAGMDLWRWRRDVETAHRLAIPVGDLVARVAVSERLPVAQVLQSIIAAKGLMPDWYRVQKWANEHGLDLWDTTGEAPTEGA